MSMKLMDYEWVLTCLLVRLLWYAFWRSSTPIYMLIDSFMFMSCVGLLLTLSHNTIVTLLLFLLLLYPTHVCVRWILWVLFWVWSRMPLLNYFINIKCYYYAPNEKSLCFCNMLVICLEYILSFCWNSFLANFISILCF